ncbi:MAG: SGNH/GDSL hydrolase family protein [Hyphomicrobiales bacterium]|nr:SGNH/GDSL hydrolase family protein [Hyphomicrobiales bacterium]
MKPNLAVALTWFGLPVYLWQGLAVRRKAVRSSPPSPQTVEPVEGTGTPYRLLLLGDSSAAGVGVDDINLSLGGQMLKLLAEQTGRPVEIEIVGCNSATAGQIRDFVVPNIERRDFTHIIINIGTNDAKNFHTIRRFGREFGSLLYATKARFPRSSVLWSGIMDMEKVPSLPSPLNKILGARSREMLRCGESLCRDRLAEVPQGFWDPSRENFAADGFHASARGYQLWAKGLVTHIVSSDSPSE